MTDASTRAENLAPWIAGVLLAIPTLVAYYPPMTDLPFHEAAVAILSNLHDTRRYPPGLYVLNLGEPNQLFHMLAWPLAMAAGSRWAVKAVIAGAVAALPVCGARFARHVGASPLAALVIAPMALGWLFTWGLIANLLGLAALLAMLPVLDRFQQTPTWGGAGKVVGALVLLYFAHEAMMFVYAGAALLFAAMYAWSWKKTLARASPFVVGIGITYAQAKWQQRYRTPTAIGMPVFWHPLLHKLARIPYIVLPASDTVVQLSMLGMCAVAVASFFWLRSRERGPNSGPTDATATRWEHVRSWALRYRWEVLAAALFAGYLAFPLTMYATTLVYQRWFPPAFAILVVVAAPRDLWTRPARITRLLCALLPMATLLVTWPSFADSGRAYQQLQELVPLIAPGSAVAELDLGPGDPSRTFSMGPSGGRVLAQQGGRLDYSFTDTAISPVVIPKQYRWNESLIRIGFDCWAFRPEHDFRSFRYALVRTSDAGVAALAQIALAPEGRYVATAGEWVLFESTLTVIPPNSPPIHLPNPPPEELRDRAARIVEKAGGAPVVEVPPEHPPDPSAPNGQHF